MMHQTSFETIPKSIYTHGFENIYALENIDPRSIRPLKPTSLKLVKPFSQSSLKFQSPTSNQLEFDLGLGFQFWIDPFFLHEPVSVLELNRFAEKILEGTDIKCIKDLLENDFKGFISRGIGQGHIDEIQQKLDQYLINKNLQKSFGIDFASFLRVIFAGISRKKAYLFLMDYNLQDLISLLPSESVEIKRLSVSNRKEWIQDTLKSLISESKSQFVQQKIKEITHNLFIPWMEKRQGFASLAELLEHMENLSIEPDLTEKTLILISELYFSSSFPLEAYLYQAAERVYSINEPQSKIFFQIQSLAMSYFYSGSHKYSLAELRQWLQREFAKEWIGITNETIDKVLSLSSLFYMWKNSKGQIEVKLS